MFEGPHNRDSERAVLGAILVSQGEAAFEARDLLGEDGRFFYDPDHSEVYEAMLRVYGADAKVDPVVLMGELGGVEAAQRFDIPGLMGAVPTSANIGHYAQQVRKCWQQRQLLTEADRLKRQVDAGEAPELCIEALEGNLLEIARHNVGQVDCVDAKSGSAQAMEYLRELAASDGKVTGLPTGINELDKMTRGLQGGDLIVLAARPSVGKTAFALNLVHRIAVMEGIPVLFLSLEMPARQLFTRLFAIEGVPMSHIQTGFLGRKALETAEVVEAKVGKAPIEVMDTAHVTISGICSVCRKFAAKHPKGLIVLDYLQLVATSQGQGSKQRYEVVGEMSRALKGLAKECQMPFVMLAQLGREAESMDDGFKMVRCLRESGNIEQDADLICILHKTTVEGGGSFSDQTIPVTFTLAKHRNGPTGTILLDFDKSQQRFFVPGEELVEEMEGQPIGDSEPFDGYVEDEMPF